MPSVFVGPGLLRRALCRLLAGLLVVSLPAPGMTVLAADSPDPEPGAGALSVVTEPAGAAVYLDGRHAGQTPVELEALTAGEHRVRLVKHGFLENSRVVSVAVGRLGTVQVRMTPETASAGRLALQQDPETGGGGGGKKALLIGLGVAAVGAGVYVATKKSNKAPTPGTIGVSPTGTGIASVTSFDFSSQGASDPDGDALSYNWNFGDGGTATGQTAAHVFNSSGSLQVTLTVSDGEKSATVTASVAVRDVNGRWVSSLSGTTRTFTLTQSGANFTGSYTNSNVAGNTGTVRGTLASPRRINGTAGLVRFLPFTFAGDFSAELSQFSVVANGSGFSNTSLVFNRQ